MANQDAQQYNHEGQTQKGLNGRDLSIDHNDKKTEDSAPEEKQPPDSINDDPTEKVNTANEAGTEISHEENESGKLKESSELEYQKNPQISSLKESNEMQAKPEHPLSFVQEKEGSSAALNSKQTEVSKDVEMVPDLKSSENNEPCQLVAPLLVEEASQSQAAETSKNVDIISDSLPAGKNVQLVKSNSVGDQSQPIEVPKDVDMSSELPSEAKECQQPAAPNSVVENGTITGLWLSPSVSGLCMCLKRSSYIYHGGTWNILRQNSKSLIGLLRELICLYFPSIFIFLFWCYAVKDQKGSKKEKPDCRKIKEDNTIDKLKRAAISALSAAAVKARILEKQEEDQIRQLAALVIEKQVFFMLFSVSMFSSVVACINLIFLMGPSVAVA